MLPFDRPLEPEPAPEPTPPPAKPRKQAGFELIPGVLSIKKGKDFEFDGTYLVTLADGSVHGIYFDRQSSNWHHSKPKGNRHFDSYLGLTRQDALHRLVQHTDLFNPM